MSAAETMTKTNAVRLLEAARVAYQLKEYAVDESDLSATRVARKIGFPEAQVFKTLAVRAEKSGVLLALVPADTELDLKAVAVACGSKKCELLSLKDVQPTTGYVRGGVSPLGTKQKFPVYLDSSALAFDMISISAGMRGLQIVLAPQDLIALTHASTAALTAFH